MAVNVSFNIAGKCFARVRGLIVKVKQRRLTTPLPSVYAVFAPVILSLLWELALIESPRVSRRAFCTRVVDKRTFPEVSLREESFTRGPLARGKLH